MAPGSAALVMFAIRSAIKLGQQTRLAYVDATKRQELVLPLPNFFSAVDDTSAAQYFADSGQSWVAATPRLKDLLDKRLTTSGLTADEKDELLALYAEFRNLDEAKRGKLKPAADGTHLTADELTALVTVRQWRRGTDPNPSVAQRLAGAFIEIGVDYFVNVPGALNKDSRQGRAVLGFLEAMEEINFSEAQLRDLPERLFVATLETIAEHGELLSGDPKVQQLVKVVSASLSADVAAHIEKIRQSGGGAGNLVLENRALDWADLVFRSVLSSAGREVLTDPKGLLGIEGPGASAAVGHVGTAVLDLILEHPTRDLDKVFSRRGLETVLQASLTVVAEHPELLVRSKNEGLKKLLAGVADELGGYDTLLTPDLLPALTRLILEKTGENIELLWPDLADGPGKNIPLTAVKTTLEILTQKPESGAKWKPEFGRAELVAVSDAVLDEIVENPQWVLAESGKVDENLRIALEATLKVLRAQGDARLSRSTAVAVLHASIRAVTLRKEFLDKIPSTGQPLVAATLDAVLSQIFQDDRGASSAWQLARDAAVKVVVQTVLGQVAKSGIDKKVVDKVRAFMKKQIARLKKGEGFDLSAFETQLQKALAKA